MSAIPYIGLLVGGLPLQLLHSLVFCIKYYNTLVLLLLIKICLMLFTVLKPSCHAPSGIPLLLPIIISRDVALSLCLSYFMNQASPSWFPTLCVQQYGALHQLPYFFLCVVALVILLVWHDSLLLRILISPCRWMIIFCMIAISESLLAR